MRLFFNKRFKACFRKNCKDNGTYEIDYNAKDHRSRQKQFLVMTNKIFHSEYRGRHYSAAKDYFEDQAIYIDDPKSIIQISSRLRDALARSKKFGEKNTLFLNKYSIEALSQLFKKMKFFE